MFQEDTIIIGKYKINYLRVGHGAHYVLCLPGALGTMWTDFKPQIEGFDREKFSLIVWEAPNFEKSRLSEGKFHSDFYAQDVDAALELMKALNIPKFSILGWCYGGVTSIFLTAKYPDAVNKLVVWGARSYIQQNELEFMKEMKDLSIWSEEMRKPRLEIYGEERLVKLVTQIVDAVENIYHNNDGTVLCVEVLSKVSCPTLILHGDKDPIIGKANVDSLLNNIQGSRLHVYPEGKHNVHLRFAEDFNQRVQEFLLED